MSDRVDRIQDLAAEDRLGELYRLYSKWLTARLRRRVGVDLAEELTQETYLRLAPYQHAGEIRHPKALLLRIATNLSVDAERRARRRGLDPATRPDQDDPPEPPRQTEALLLKQVILSLPEPLRQVFVLSRFGGLTYEQIGERLGVSVKTVEWRMSKALAHCAAQLRL